MATFLNLLRYFLAIFRAFMYNKLACIRGEVEYAKNRTQRERSVR